MMEQPRAIAIIHARGGSKRIPLKNLKKVGGKPLVAYPIELCKQCRWIERIILSTDHDEIMTLGREYGAEVPFRRPPEISEDVPSELVTLHALKFFIDHGETMPEFAVTLTPATPFTSAESLDEAFKLICSNSDWDGVTAVRRAKEHPEWMIVLDESGHKAKTLLGNPLDGEFNVSQNLKNHYYPTGAFWINRVDHFIKYPSLYGKNWGAVVMDIDEAVDIDWPDDIEEAETLIKRRKGIIR